MIQAQEQVQEVYNVSSIKNPINVKEINYYQYGLHAEDMLINTLAKCGKRYIKIPEVDESKYDNGKRTKESLKNALMKDPFFQASMIADIDIFKPKKDKQGKEFKFPVDSSGISIKTISKSSIEHYTVNNKEVEYISLPFQKTEIDPCTNKVKIKKDYINKHLEHLGHTLKFTSLGDKLHLIENPLCQDSCPAY